MKVNKKIVPENKIKSTFLSGLINKETKDEKNISSFFYCCGPTTYDDLHIGNLKTIYLSRVIYNLCSSIHNDIFYDSKTKYGMNFTDIDDKIIEKSKNFSSFFECSYFYLKTCDKTLNEFGLKPNNDDITFVRATDFIPDIIQIISKILEYKFAYCVEGDGIYFDISKLFEYEMMNKLNIKKENIPFYMLIPGNKKRNNIYKKEDDFVLWKFNDKEPFWQTPWGKGRPGWHIECSSIVKFFIEKYKCEKYHFFGGSDLIFPHHENQFIVLDIYLRIKKFIENGEFYSELVTVNNFSPLFIERKKMSKSLNNIIYLKNIEKNMYDALKLLFLSNSTNTPTNFSFSLLEENNKKINNIKNKFIYNNGNILYTNDKMEKILDECMIGDTLKNLYNLPLFFSRILSMKKDEIEKIDKDTFFSFLNKKFFLF